MHRKQSGPLLLIVLGLLVTIAFVRVAVASSAAPFTIINQSIDGGGTLFSSGGSFTLSATVGQSDASAKQAVRPFVLVGGFWVPQHAVEATPSATPNPSATPSSSVTANPSETLEPMLTPSSSATANPSTTANPGGTLEPMQTPNPNATANPSATPNPNATPNPGETLEPMQTPNPNATQTQGQAVNDVFLPIITR